MDTSLDDPDRAAHISPFAIHEARLSDLSEVELLQDLGATMVRLAAHGALVWDAVEKERGVYDWGQSDLFVTRANEIGVRVLSTSNSICAVHNPDFSSRKIPVHMDWYLEFVRRAAERYDADGVDDAPGSPVIDVIQVQNEIDGAHFWDDTPANYAYLLKETYKAIKEVAPNIKVAIAGAATPVGYYDSFQSVLDELKALRDVDGGQYFEIFDIHWSAQFKGEHDYAVEHFPDGSYELGAYIGDIQRKLDEIGYEDVAFYITEMSDYSDLPNEPTIFVRHSETYHAASLVKRYIYAIAAGIQRVFWAQVKEHVNFGGTENGYFDNVALVNNPSGVDGLSHKKLAYYTYKKLTEVLEGSTWSTLQLVSSDDGVYVYRLEKATKAIWVLWNDNAAERKVKIPSIVAKTIEVIDSVPSQARGDQVTDYQTAFTTREIIVSHGEIELTVAERPLLVLEIR